MMIAGGADLFAPPPLLNFFSARIKKSESLILPDVGHSGCWEQPQDFNHAVDFIRKH
jgi:pimeloyl-ACP methyl ester carboxylesterase